MAYRTDVEFGGKTITIATGHWARQAAGSVVVSCGGTVVICTVAYDGKSSGQTDFFPLTVDYRERTYAAGKIPGGYFKREGRPSEKETLTSRMIDRPIRPLFAPEYNCATQVVCFVLSHDQQHEPEVLALLGTSASLLQSELPFLGPVTPVRVARIGGNFVLNPTFQELENSDLNLLVVCSESSIVMVEGGGKEIPESVIADALEFAFREAQTLNAVQRRIASETGKPKRVFKKTEVEWKDPKGQPCNADAIFASLPPRILEAIQQPGKAAVYAALDQLRSEYSTHFDMANLMVKIAFEKRFSSIERDVARSLILTERRRNDGRSLDEIRAITCDIDVLPCVHGSAVFTRGQTQALVTLPLGTTQDEQRIDDLEGESYKSFMLHYNFPAFSVGETGGLRGPGRREVGHGALAARAIAPMIPQPEVFPYTIRIVSDILESNGSSSMATVCGATLCLLDGGVPIPKAVAGIAMGLVTDESRYSILSDISGLEDHLGDMDFKVAGTRDGITAIQMDIKLTGFDISILKEALEQARQGRIHILDIIENTIRAPRSELKPHAPRIHLMKINPEKIAAVIGPGGKVIRALTAETGAKIDIEDDGTIKISSSDAAKLNDAISRISLITEEATVGKDYWGTVRRIESYGAFIEIIPGSEGLLHISRVANYRVNEMRDEMNEGDRVLVRVCEIDRMGKIKLTRKELIDEGLVEAKQPPQPHSDDSSEQSERPRYPERRGGYDQSRDNRSRGDRPRDNRSRGDRPFRNDRYRDDGHGDRPNRPPRHHDSN